MKKTQTTKDDSGRDSIMVRTDLTLRDLMEEKPSSRWDPGYWNPKYEKIIKALSLSGLELTDGDEIISAMTNGNRDREWAKNSDNKIRFIQVVNVLNTGVNFEAGDSSKHYAKKNGFADPERSRLKDGDVLLISGATGSIGRACVLSNLPESTNISQDINLIRLNPGSRVIKYYFTIFLLSLFGKSQLEKFSKGVSGQIKVGFDHIKAIKIPILPGSVQKNIESEYKKMSVYHDKAMDAKKKDDESGFKKNIEVAEKMLKDLIAKTEAVIRGERKDVI